MTFMPTETITPEIVGNEESELAVVIQQNALPPAVAQSLQSSFAPLFVNARKILERSLGITVTDASQKLEIKLARECRLALRSVRVDGDNIRKSLKDQSLREGRAIDGFQNILLHITETEENRLDEQEKFAERQEQARKAALTEKRSNELLALNIDPALYQLGEMSEETFQTLVEGTRLARQAQEEARVKAEADRIAKEAADAAERERIRLENERLKREADEREASAKKEREAAALAKAEAEAQTKRERDAAEATLKAERQKAAKAAEEAAAKAKKEREEIEEAARNEKLRLQALAEVERQKAETAAREAAAKAKVEREAREKAEAELKAQKDAAAKKAAAEALLAKRAAAAPDRDKLVTYWAAIDAVKRPAMATDEGRAIFVEAEKRLAGIASYLEWEAAKL